MSNEVRVVSRRLREIWQWKEAICLELADLPNDQALDAILKKARSAAEKYNLPCRSPARALSPTGKRRESPE